MRTVSLRNSLRFKGNISGTFKKMQKLQQVTAQENMKEPMEARCNLCGTYSQEMYAEHAALMRLRLISVLTLFSTGTLPSPAAATLRCSIWRVVQRSCCGSASGQPAFSIPAVRSPECGCGEDAELTRLQDLSSVCSSALAVAHSADVTVIDGHA